MDVERGRCWSFWGRRLPRARHTVREAGCSSYLPTWMLLSTRLLSLAVVGGALCHFAAARVYTFELLPTWGLVGAALSLLASAASSASALALARAGARVRPWQRLLAALAVPLAQTSATSALLVAPGFWAFVYEPGDGVAFHAVLPHGGAAALLLLDVALAASMDFRLVYVAGWLAYLAVYLGFAWVYFAVTRTWVYEMLDYRRQPPAVTVLWYLALAASATAAGFAVLAFSRISRCFSRE